MLHFPHSLGLLTFQPHKHSTNTTQVKYWYFYYYFYSSFWGRWSVWLTLYQYKVNLARLIGLGLETVEIWTYFMIFKWVAITVNQVITELHFFELIKITEALPIPIPPIPNWFSHALHSRITIRDFLLKKT